MKALTKPETFQVMSRIYGYECNDILENEDDVACNPSGTESIQIGTEWDPSTQAFEPVYECVEVDDPDMNDC
ncbi:MAG: hypothetical protein J4F29_22055 [Candidatus Latescibacteria bacterium]|nr:hypothetical protein [Candidatus Latescibacterota bacterium]